MFLFFFRFKNTLFIHSSLSLSLLDGRYGMNTITILEENYLKKSLWYEYLLRFSPKGLLEDTPKPFIMRTASLLELRN